MKIHYSSSKQWKLYNSKLQFLLYASDIGAFWCNDHKKFFSAKHSAGVHCSYIHGVYIDGKNSRAKKIFSVIQPTNNSNPSTLEKNSNSQQIPEESEWTVKPGDPAYIIALKQELKLRSEEEEQARFYEIRRRNSPIVLKHNVAKTVKDLGRKLRELELHGISEEWVWAMRKNIVNWAISEVKSIDEMKSSNFEFFQL